MQALGIGVPGSSPSLTGYTRFARSAAAFAVGQGGLGLSSFPTMTFDVVADVAGSLVGKTVTIQIGQDTAVVFEITEGGSPAPGNVSVPISANATAAQVAVAFGTAITTKMGLLYTSLVAAGPIAVGSATVLVLIADPALYLYSNVVAVAPFSPLTTTYVKGGVFGGWLYNTWRTFAFQGLVGTNTVAAGIRNVYAPAIWPVRSGLWAWPAAMNNPSGLITPA